MVNKSQIFRNYKLSLTGCIKTIPYLPAPLRHSCNQLEHEMERLLKVRELVELRISRANAGTLFKEGEGEVLSDQILKIRIDRDDPRVIDIAAGQRALNASGTSLYYGWRIFREYSKAELESTEAFYLHPKNAFQPTGVECGTEYDCSACCRICGFGERRVGPLKLATERIPAKADLAISYAGEIVVSRRLADAIMRAKLTGARLLPVYGRGRSQKVSEHWMQLDVVANAGKMAPSTEFGQKPFGGPRLDEYRCPLGHTRGLNLISEIHLFRQSWPNADFALTADAVGRVMGMYRPERLLVVSPRFMDLFLGFNGRNYSVERVLLEPRV